GSQSCSCSTCSAAPAARSSRLPASRFISSTISTAGGYSHGAGSSARRRILATGCAACGGTRLEAAPRVDLRFSGWAVGSSRRPQVQKPGKRRDENVAEAVLEEMWKEQLRETLLLSVHLRFQQHRADQQECAASYA